MKRNFYSSLILMLCINLVQAKPVIVSIAKNLAITFYKQHSTKNPQTIALAYTENSSVGEALYYVFNINTDDGFVIVTADDAAHPIIGYSTKNKFILPKPNTNINYWLSNRKKEIIAIKEANIEATVDIAREWGGDFSSNNNLRKSNNLNSVTTVSVAPLVQTIWDQSPYYNALCPGTGANESVTGCVATAMAQVMKYWNYPAQGRDTSSYCDCTAGGYTDQWGTLSANYGATTYSWSAMPLLVNSPNLAVATLMYQCGVSVDMDYDANGSGADALSVETGGGPCSQIALVKYFKYDSTTIHGYQKIAGGYTDTTWIALIKVDLNAGRPVIYEGDDATQGGHCWVCDGYDATNLLHMNWGWSGQDDGYFMVTDLTTTGNFNPILNQEVLVGIQPPQNIDAGVSAIVSPTGVICSSTITPIVTIENFGVDTLTTCTISYQIDGGTTLTYIWTGSLATGHVTNVTFNSVVVSAGTHTLSSSTSNPNNGTDFNSSNDQISNVFVSNTIGITLPLMEGFEGSTNLPAGWSVYNPDADAAWVVTNATAFAGTNSIAFDNCDGDGNTDMTGKKDWLYTATYNFVGASLSAGVSFEVAYAKYDAGGGQYSTDTLVVYSSIDCGTTWNQIYKKGGDTLATAPAYNGSSCFLPTSANWRNEIILLPSLAGQTNVMFAFENISDWGEPIFIDNINILANGTGIAYINHSPSSVNVYPNPSNNVIYLNSPEIINSVSVTDIIGQTVISNRSVNSAQQNQIDISNLANGVYLVKVIVADNHAETIKIIKN